MPGYEHPADLVVGIDLGTWNSAACVLLGDRPVMLRPEEMATSRSNCFPSVVEFDDKGSPLQVGEYARRSMPLHPQTVVCGVKRLIGKAYQAAKKAGDIDRFAFRVSKAPDDTCQIHIGPKTYSPREITTFILEKIKRDAEADFNPLGQPIEEAVITVPAYFDPFQKSETERAALAAGFKKVHLMPEPTAAASAYRLQVERDNQYIMVIDLGAGTLDVTVALLYLDANEQLQTEEKGHGGDTALGGLDMDSAILEYVVKRHRLRWSRSDLQGTARLRDELEQAKIRLSSETATAVHFPTAKTEVHFQLLREEIDAVVSPIVDRCRAPIRIALQEAGLQPEDITHVLLVGGPTMMPIVRRVVVDEFKTNERVVREIRAIDEHGFPIHPLEAVAKGAVLGCVGRITPHGYGILLEGLYQELLARRQRYPCGATVSFTAPGRKRSFAIGVIRQAVHPDTYREQYIHLGTYEFDIQPQRNTTEIWLEWEYSENGTLNLTVTQSPSMIRLPLHDISKLDGREIPRPPNPMPRSFNPGIRARAVQVPEPVEGWSKAELESAIRCGNQILAVARARIGQADPVQSRKAQELAADLTQWISNTWDDATMRTPQIRNLNRALLNVLLIGELIDREEYNELKRGS